MNQGKTINPLIDVGFFSNTTTISIGQFAHSKLVSIILIHLKQASKTEGEEEPPDQDPKTCLGVDKELLN